MDISHTQTITGSLINSARLGTPNVNMKLFTRSVAYKHLNRQTMMKNVGNM